MKVFNDVCLQVEEDLEQVVAGIPELEAELAYLNNCDKYLIEQLLLRLAELELQVYTIVVEQYDKHAGSGCVCVVTGQSGNIGVTWFKEDPTLLHYRWSPTTKLTVSPAEKFLALMKQLEKKLQEGDWEPAVRWLNANAVGPDPVKWFE